MSDGILMLAFGEQYDMFAAHCMAYSRKNRTVPLTVLTNLKTRSEKWNEAGDVDFIEFDWSQDANRQAKTTMNEYTPYDRTIYMDCDAILQKPGIEKYFDAIPDIGLLLNVYSRWTSERQAPGLYRRAFKNAGVSIPMTIYYGACLGFQKNEATAAFFRRWNELWKINGSGREMPALACAVKNTRIAVKEISRAAGLFSWPMNSNVVIQHEYGGKLRARVGCPEFRSYKPFDRQAIGQWKQ